MATKPPPPPRKSGKGEPPESDQTRSNLQKPEPGKIVDLNFKVPEEFRKNFKIAAVTQGMNQIDFLMELFRYWSERNG